LKPKIIFACDYRGVDLKKQLFEYAKTLDYDFKDIGIEEGSLLDYVDITKNLVSELTNQEAFGVIICENGQGVAMAANRYKTIRAAICRNIEDAMSARRKLDANVLCLGSKQTSLEEAINCLDAFISTPFKAEKHKSCVSKLFMNVSDHTYNGINVIVRAVIMHQNHVLLSVPTNSNTQFSSNLYFLPGGHIDYLEPAIEALKRELLEEMSIEIKNVDFLNALECSWNRKGNPYHELNLVYRVDIENLSLKNPPKSSEPTLEFIWAPLEKIKNYKILPEKLKPIIQNVGKSEKEHPLYLSQMAEF
jgi:ribose 5-phosphate isomerase B